MDKTLEDVYVEARVNHRFPGNYKAGIALMNTQLRMATKSLGQQMADGVSPLIIATNLILEYAMHGDIINPEGLENKYTEALYRCLAYIDNAVFSDNPNARFQATNKILLNLWPFINEAINKAEEANGDSGDDEGESGDSIDNTGNPSPSLQDLLEQLSQAMEERSGTPKGKNKPSKSENGKGEPSKEELESSMPQRTKRKLKPPAPSPKSPNPAPKEENGEDDENKGQGKEKENTPTSPTSGETEAEGDEDDKSASNPKPSFGEDGEGEEDSESSEDEGNGGGETDNSDDSEESETPDINSSNSKDTNGGDDNELGDDENASGENKNPESKSESEATPQLPEDDYSESPPFQDVVDYETGRIPFEETDDFDTGGEGGFERNREYTGSGYGSVAEDIERLLDKMAQPIVEEGLEDEIHSELQDMANEIRYGNAHKGIKVQVNRMVQVDDYLIESYNRIAKPLLMLSKRLQQQVSQILKDKREGGKLTGLLYGKRFSVRDSVRGDGRQFYNTRLPSEPMALAVAILCDESGSMSSNDRATIARAASIVLYDFCRRFNIPVAVYGHTEDFEKGEKGVEIYAHAEFDSIDNKDKYRLMDISSRSGNRDGAALRFTAERLMKRPEPMKLLILISDGQPAGAGGYGGSEAEADLRGIKLEYQRKGIKMFAAAIGDDKPNIERIYGDGFLDITDLNKLPMNLCALLQQYIRTMP